jgi:outer membrane lipoprotein SlyB
MIIDTNQPPPQSNWSRIAGTVKWYLCGTSPENNIKNWFLEGAAKGFIAGAITGGIAGTILGAGVGDEVTIPVAAALGGIAEGTVGASVGIIWGTAASGACYAAGVY